MGTSGSTHQRGSWAPVAAQPRSLPILVPPFAIGLLGALAVGLTVGFGDTDDAAVGLVRGAGAILTGVVAGVVGRGVWGWVAASAGASLAVSPFFLSEEPDPSVVLGAAMGSFVVLAPGYGLARVLAYALRLLSLRPEGRSAALRMPLRRALRVGVALSGAGVVVIVQSAIALSGAANLELVEALTISAAIGGSYVMYRLVDRLDRGERAPALVFAVLYGSIGLGLFGLMLAAEAPVPWAALETLVPSSFMALAPRLLVHLVRQQPLVMPRPSVEPDEPPGTSSAARS